MPGKTYVIRDGKFMEKPLGNWAKDLNLPTFPTPHVGRFEAYESPIDGARITSDRQREKDLSRSNSFDPRDLPKDHEWKRGRAVQKQEADAQRTGQPEQLDFWRDRD